MHGLCDTHCSLQGQCHTMVILIICIILYILLTSFGALALAKPGSLPLVLSASFLYDNLVHQITDVSLERD